jgi:hypothetical protein
MELLRCKVRLSVLWVVMAVGTAASMFLSLLMPGVIQGIMDGEMEGMELTEWMMVVMALFFIIPIALSILTLTLKGSANRWLNFIFGIIWVIWFIVEIFGHATAAEPVSIGMWLMLTAGIVFSVFIVYFAWNLPKHQE